MFLMFVFSVPSTRLVLAVHSMDVGRRGGARGVIDTAAPDTQSLEELGIVRTVNSVLKGALDTSSM